MMQGNGAAVQLGLLETAWGWLGLARTDAGLCGLNLPVVSEDIAWRQLCSDWPAGRIVSEFGMPESKAQLISYFDGHSLRFAIPLDLPRPGGFWHRVWRVVSEIPYGETRSYGEVAGEVGSPGAARAVGAAMASNPVAIVVPCHRVVGCDGRLVGFGGGLDQKRRLLEMESAAVAATRREPAPNCR